MDQQFTNNDPQLRLITELKNEIQNLRQTISQLEGQINSIQQNCNHVFLEAAGFRECTKCNKVDVNYY